MPPPIERVLETALYVDDPGRTAAFYRDVLGFPVIDEGPRLIALDAGKASVLLVFKRGATAAGAGPIPAHDGGGPVHLAFAIREEELEPWQRHLADRGIAVESTIRWPRGGTSLYFRDPDGHSVELATPGLWSTY